MGTGLPLRPNSDFIKNNPHLYPHLHNPNVVGTFLDAPVKKRIRQSTKPLMNKLEESFLRELSIRHPGEDFYPQAVTLKLANGLRYTPDFISFNLKKVFEVKGEWVDGDSFPKLKMAASVFPDLEFYLEWRHPEGGCWCEQKILHD